MTRALVVALLAGLLAPAGAGADDSFVRVGDRVRVTLLAGPPPSTGRLLEFDAGSLALRLDEAERADSAARRIPRAAIATLELDRSHGHAGIGALLGLGVGLMVGIVVAGEMEGEGEEGDFRKVGATLGGPFYGAALGAIMGALIREERWEPRSLPPAAETDGGR